MKIRFLVAVASLALFSCNKSEEVVIQKNNIPQPQLSAINQDIDYIVTCEGTCSGSDESCETLKSTQDKKYKCSCQSDNCSMVVEIFYGQQSAPDEIVVGDDAESLLDQELEGQECFQEYLEQHVLDVHGVTEFAITKIRFCYRDDNFGAHYYYRYNDGSEDIDETVLFVQYAQDGKKYKVSCNGHCDTSVQLCVEEFGFGAQSINCSCQSDNCYMVVEDLTPGPHQ